MNHTLDRNESLDFIFNMSLTVFLVPCKHHITLDKRLRGIILHEIGSFEDC